MRMHTAISTLVGEESQGVDEWNGTVAGANGFVYGIPAHARQVVKFDPVDKSMTLIGPYFCDKYSKWNRGAMTDNGVIYCPPYHEECGILKIDTNTDTVIELDVTLLPELGYNRWESCASLSLDGCIYFMPFQARRIMKLDPNDNDAMSSVGNDVGDGLNDLYSGTVIIGQYVYGIPSNRNHILKYDAISGTTSFVAEAFRAQAVCGNGAVGRDGCIYVLNELNQVVKIDTTNYSHSFVGNRIQSDPNDRSRWGFWGDAVLGIDGCIYWPPCISRRTLKCDPYLDQTSLVGDDCGISYNSIWSSGGLATDGVIYCLPRSANQVLAINPIGELLAATKAKVLEYPEDFGHLFQTIETDGDDSVPSLTNFGRAVHKFGENKVLEVLGEAMEPVNVHCRKFNLYPFMIVASKEESPVCAIHYLLRRDLAWVINP